MSPVVALLALVLVGLLVTLLVLRRRKQGGEGTSSAAPLPPAVAAVLARPEATGGEQGIVSAREVVFAIKVWQLGLVVFALLLLVAKLALL